MKQSEGGVKLGKIDKKFASANVKEGEPWKIKVKHAHAKSFQATANNSPKYDKISQSIEDLDEDDMEAAVAFKLVDDNN